MGNFIEHLIFIIIFAVMMNVMAGDQLRRLTSAQWSLLVVLCIAAYMGLSHVWENYEKGRKS
jgi:hypothetical protein